MCGIFGQVSKSKISQCDLSVLAKHSQQRGRDFAGLLFCENNNYKIIKNQVSIVKNIKKTYESSFLVSCSGSSSNNLIGNQPAIKKGVIVFFNGMIVDNSLLQQSVDSISEANISIAKNEAEGIALFIFEKLNQEQELNVIVQEIMSKSVGILSCAVVLPAQGKLLLFSNNGSMYLGYIDSDIYFATEKFGLEKIKCENIEQICNSYKIIDIPTSQKDLLISDEIGKSKSVTVRQLNAASEEKLLQYESPEIKRCSKCLLPITMPFIKFDAEGICNYCHNYKLRNKPKPKEELFNIVEAYKSRDNKADCIVPFSGGRDSCYGLHLIINELGLRPITYTYDWGMVTDLGKRNISRMCSKLGVENIVVMADVAQKHKNIKMNLKAWLKSPHLGMMAMLTAGDKHFFRYVEHIKNQTGINLNLWGVNPLEVTHFKTGFLGIPPDFEEKRVYSSGVAKQIRYHLRRFKAMLESPSYFNSSLWDTLSGEYFRSFTEKKDYYHIFDYWRWDENIVNSTLINEYGWEIAKDTSTTWRIGDGTAAFYNYVYKTVAGFTEHDTFRSNQIREGDITREKALKLIEDENRPRYENIKWYLETLGFDFVEVIKTVNSIPKLYKK